MNATPPLQKHILCTLSLYCVLTCLLWQHSACADSNYERAQNYIQKYKPLAIDEMMRTGIPASIKLAQALLETDYGSSRLATVGNNHFGIKCKSYWMGDTLLVDDDAPQECFRRYASAYDSYIDHSEFLRYHREGYYSHLFQLSRTDYVGWAQGLQAAGYATNPNYAKKIIDLIQRYHLNEFDRPETAFITSPTFYNANPAAYAYTTTPTPAAAASPDKNFSKTFVPKPSFNANPPKPLVNFNASAAPPAQTTNTGNSSSTPQEKETAYNPFRLDEVVINGLKAVVANTTLHLAYIAYHFGISEEKLYSYNEASQADKQIKAGIPIFLQEKKKKAANGIDVHMVQPDETLFDIAQRYGIRVKTLYKLNDLEQDFIPKAGHILRLR